MRLRSSGHIAGYPKLVRAGLAHMMGAWARCYVWCHDNKLPMLAPAWLKFRLGPYLRREPDKRQYHRFFTSDGYVSGFERWLYLSAARRVAENEGVKLTRGRPSPRRTLVVFHDDIGFSSIRGRHDIVKRELIRITKAKYVAVALIPEPFIGVHIRRGDFSAPTSAAELLGGRHNTRVPLEWFIEAVCAIRSGLANPAPVRVFSDGSAAELSPLLSLPDVQLMPVRAAITDLLALSQAKVLVGSGSGFSMWAAFLGQMPSVWHPGQRLDRLLDGHSKEVDLLEVEWSVGSPLPSEMFERIEREWAVPPALASVEELRMGGEASEKALIPR